MRKSKLTIYDIVSVAMFTALVAAGAFIKIPIPMVPFTLQYFFVVLAAILLGTKKGFLSVLCYILLGLVGIPIFASGGGPQYVLYPTFGYIIGFLLSTLVVGKICHKEENPSFGRILVGSLAGLLVVYVLGMIYLYLIKTFYLGSTITFKTLFLSCFLVFVPGDSLCCVLAALLGKRLIPILNKGKIKNF